MSLLSFTEPRNWIPPAGMPLMPRCYWPPAGISAIEMFANDMLTLLRSAAAKAERGEPTAALTETERFAAAIHEGVKWEFIAPPLKIGQPLESRCFARTTESVAVIIANKQIYVVRLADARAKA